MAKLTKEEVDYSKGLQDAHCGICEHYRHGECLLVQGAIEPDFWCKRFEPGLRATIVKAAMYKGPNGPQKSA